MKKILFVLLLLSGVVFAQNTDKGPRMTSADQTLYDAFEVTTEVLRTASVGGTTLGVGANSVTTVDTLFTSGTGVSSIPCKRVTLTNYTSGLILYVGATGVTTSTGFPLQYLDNITLMVADLAQVYVVSSGAAIDVRYVYEN